MCRANFFESNVILRLNLPLIFGVQRVILHLLMHGSFMTLYSMSRHATNSHYSRIPSSCPSPVRSFFSPVRSCANIAPTDVGRTNIAPRGQKVNERVDCDRICLPPFETRHLQQIDPREGERRPNERRALLHTPDRKCYSSSLSKCSPGHRKHDLHDGVLFQSLANEN